MALTCQKITDLLVDFIDGELDSETEAKLEAHLDSCPPCVDFIAKYRQTGTLCKKALDIEMPQSLKSSLSEFLRSELQSPEP